MRRGMAGSIRVHVPRRGIGSDLSEALAERGLTSELVDDDEVCALEVRFAQDEHDRLLAEATTAIEAYLSDRLLPLVVQRLNGDCIVRPPAD